MRDGLLSLVALNPSRARTSTNLPMVQVTIIMIRSMKMPVRIMMTGMIAMTFTNRIRSRRDGDLVGMMEVVLSTPDDHHGDHANPYGVWTPRTLAFWMYMKMMMMIGTPGSMRPHKECSKLK